MNAFALVDRSGRGPHVVAARSRLRSTALRLLVCVAAWPAICVAAAPGSADDPAPRAPVDIRIKAASLFHFLGYVEWPPATATASAYRVGVIEADDLSQELTAVASGRLVDGRAVVVRRMAAADPLVDVDAIYIGLIEPGRLATVIGRAQGLPILVVTSADGALNVGSMINFRIVDSRVRFEVSLDAVEHAGLHVSSRMLSVALQVVRTQPR